MSNYKYDIAISLCKEDVGFARKLVDALNPNLAIFFYEHKQEELISKSGPEAFAKVFKEESRIVVILSRKEWGNSFYTELENNAIIDRLKEGFGFLFVIPLVPKEKPAWYPETRIYADPTKFSIEELARFIEFKVTEQGGEVKPVSFQERAAALINKINTKKALILSQRTQEAIAAVRRELNNLNELVKTKYEVEIKQAGFASHSFDPSDIYRNSPSISLNQIQLAINITDPNNIYYETSQEFEIRFVILDKSTQKTISKSGTYKYMYDSLNSGWSELINIDKRHLNHFNIGIFFGSLNTSIFYDLKERISTADLIEYWFNKLLDAVSSEITKHLN